MNFLHKLSHFFKLNKYNIVAWNDSGKTYMGLQCNTCHQVEKESIKLIASYSDTIEIVEDDAS